MKRITRMMVWLRHGLRKDCGVALLNALIVLSVVAAVAARLSVRDLEGVNRFSLMSSADQARLLALAAETQALMTLEQDASDNEIDHLNEDWAQEQALTVDNAALQRKIIDLQSFLNINSLRTSEEEVDEEFSLQLKRLLELCKARSETLDAIIDWVFEKPPTGLSRSNIYRTGKIPYRRFGHPMVGVSELRLIYGISAKVFKALQDSVTALPEPTPLNVNTAQALTLRSLSPHIDQSTANQIIQHREQNPFEKVTNFYSFIEKFVPDASANIPATSLSTSSSWFLIISEVQFSTVTVQLFSLVKRSQEDDEAQENKLEVILRAEDRF